MVSPINKYVWLISLLSRYGEISFPQIQEEWRNSSLSKEPGEVMVLSRKTFYNWRGKIIEVLGILIEWRKVGRNTYYFLDNSSSTGNRTRDWLIANVTVSNELINSRDISDRILLESVPSGQHFLQPILQAIKENRMIEMTYQAFGKESKTILAEPYYVKLFHQRWYLIAYNPEYVGTLRPNRTYSLDRVQQLTLSDQTFHPKADIGIDAYFTHFYGVDKLTVYPEPQQIQIKCSVNQSRYWLTLPVHESQQVLKTLPSGEVIFLLTLYPTYDFTQFLLSQGPEIEVISPVSYREEIAQHVRAMAEHYQPHDEAEK